jgi:hypothetical protein
MDDLRKYRREVLDVQSRLPEIVHSTSPAPAARRTRVAGGAEEPLLARRTRSSTRRRHDAYAAPRRRRTRARSRRLSLRLRERLCSTHANAALSELVQTSSVVECRRRGWLRTRRGSRRAPAARPAVDRSFARGAVTSAARIASLRQGLKRAPWTWSLCSAAGSGCARRRRRQARETFEDAGGRLPGWPARAGRIVRFRGARHLIPAATKTRWPPEARAAGRA